MALDYILNNTGPEVQERLDQVPVTQVQLTDEIANREAADAALQDSIGAETTRAEGAEQALDGRISAVEGKVPQDATPQNPLADKDWVAGSIATATADFITASVNDLVNYYLKSETYTKAEVQHIVDAVKQFNYQSVPELPTASAATTGIIYLVPSADPQSGNVKDEYITVYQTNEMGVTYYSWEQIGSTAIDLADYYTKSQTDAAITADLNTALASYSTTAQMNTAIETAIANLDLSDTYETKGAAAAVVGDAGEDYNTLAKIEEKLLPVEEASGDKVYEAGSGKGLGRKNLPLNSIGNKNLLSQSMINQANTVYVVQNDYEIGSDGSVNLNEDPISVTIGGVNYYCKEVSLNAGETILLTTTGSAKIIVNDGGSWTLYSYNYYTAQSNTTIRLGAVPTSQTSTINYIKTGGSITIPANCTLKFDGGSISGGTIVFNGTKLENPKFVNCVYNGNVQVDFLDDRNFTSTNDDNCLSWLITQALLLGIKLTINRDYTIELNPNNALILITSNYTVSNAVIDFNGHKVTDTWEATGANQTAGFIKINGTVNGLKVCNGDFLDENNSTHQYARTSGMCVLQTFGDCSNIEMSNITMTYGDSVHRHGGYTKEQNLTHNGLINSRYSKIRCTETGYSIAIYRGCNLDIEVYANHPHRGLYLSGVENTRVKYKGYYPEETHCHILLQECVYYKDAAFTVPEMIGCSNIDIVAEIESSPENFSESIVTLGAYGTGIDNEFNFRTTVTNHSDIRLLSPIIGSANNLVWLYSSNPQYAGTSVSFNNIEVCNADLSQYRNFVSTNIPDGYMSFRMNGCKASNSSSIGNLQFNGNSSNFKVDIISESSELGYIGALVPTNIILVNSTYRSRQDTALLHIYPYPLYLHNGMYNATWSDYAGKTTTRPVLSNNNTGQCYFDVTLKKPIWWDGSSWRESDGTKAGVLRGGMIVERPALSNIVFGFMYLCDTAFTVDTTNYPAGIYSYIGQVEGVDTWITPNGASVADSALPSRV